MLLVSAWLFSVLALISSVVSLVIHSRTGSSHQLQSAVRQLTLDVQEVFDRVEHWTRRDRVRKMRDGRESSAAAENPLPLTPAEAKIALRRRLYSGNSGVSNELVK